MANIFARMRNLIGSSAEWVQNNIIIGLGELAIEPYAGGTILRVGDGITPYSSLPFTILTPTGADPNIAVLASTKADKSVAITVGAGLLGGGDLSQARNIAISPSSNGYGTRTVSALDPTGGNDGDIWYQV